MRLSAEQEALVLKTYLRLRSLEGTAAALGRNYKAVRRVVSSVPGLLRDRGRDEIIPVRHDAFDEPLSEEAAYWIGFLAADGCVAVRKHGQKIVQMGLGGEDAGHVQKFLSFISPGRRPCVTSRGGWPLILGAVSSDRLAGALARYGFVRRKTYNFPLVPPTCHVAAFWRGYFDGDGGIHLYPNRASIVAILIALPNVMRSFLAWTELVTGRRAPVARPHAACPSMVSVHFDGTHLPIALLRALYEGSSVYLDRKHALWKVAEERLRSRLEKNTAKNDAWRLRNHKVSGGGLPS